MARPRTPIGTFGQIDVRTNPNGSVRARTRFRDDDGQLRPVEATGPTHKAAERNLKEKIARRSHYATGMGELSPDTTFAKLVEVWLEDIELEDRIAASTRELYERDMRSLVMPAFAHYIRRTIFSLGAMESASDVQSEIERLVDRAGAAMKLRPRLTIVGPLRTAVAPAVVPDLLAVLGEALANVSRHARASTVDVHVGVDASCVSVSVVDDGQGMDLKAPQTGLDNMRKRAIKHGGDVTVESAAGSGTNVTWTVPSTPRARPAPGPKVPPPLTAARTLLYATARALAVSERPLDVVDHQTEMSSCRSEAMTSSRPRDRVGRSLRQPPHL